MTSTATVVVVVADGRNVLAVTVVLDVALRVISRHVRRRARLWFCVNVVVVCRRCGRAVKRRVASDECCCVGTVDNFLARATTAALTSQEFAKAATFSLISVEQLSFPVNLSLLSAWLLFKGLLRCCAVFRAAAWETAAAAAAAPFGQAAATALSLRPLLPAV